MAIQYSSSDGIIYNGGPIKYGSSTFLVFVVAEGSNTKLVGLLAMLGQDRNSMPLESRKLLASSEIMSTPHVEILQVPQEIKVC